MNRKLDNSIKRRRDRLRLSQQALAERVGVSRQAILAIEAGRQNPSTSLAFQLARALECSVDALFKLQASTALEVRIATPGVNEVEQQSQSARVALGCVEGQWAAHRLPADATVAADGILVSEAVGSTATVRPLMDTDQLTRNVLVAGCAPLLGALSQRVGGRFFDARLTWLLASSRQALNLLEARLVHVAGVHLADPNTGADNIEMVRRRFPGQRLLIVNLTRWRQGFVVPTGNPKAIRTASDLLQPGLRFVGREEGAGANKLATELLAAQGSILLRAGSVARGHEDVARRVQCGAADVGVAIESVALARGLGFVPLVEERFDLVIPASLAESTPVARLIDAIDDPGFRTETAHLPGYDSSISGHVTTLEAA